jgi:hypothetical protein
MKTVLKGLFVLLFSAVVVGCKEEPKPAPQPEEPKESIYKGLETPVDRSRSKEY